MTQDYQLKTGEKISLISKPVVVEVTRYQCFAVMESGKEIPLAGKYENDFLSHLFGSIEFESFCKKRGYEFDREAAAQV